MSTQRDFGSKVVWFVENHTFITLILLGTLWIGFCYLLSIPAHREWQGRYNACIADGQKPYVCEALASNRGMVVLP